MVYKRVMAHHLQALAAEMINLSETLKGLLELRTGHQVKTIVMSERDLERFHREGREALHPQGLFASVLNCTNRQVFCSVSLSSTLDLAQIQLSFGTPRKTLELPVTSFNNLEQLALMIEKALGTTR
jgi:hypothetical protein